MIGTEPTTPMTEVTVSYSNSDGIVTRRFDTLPQHKHLSLYWQTVIASQQHCGDYFEIGYGPRTNVGGKLRWRIASRRPLGHEHDDGETIIEVGPEARLPPTITREQFTERAAALATSENDLYLGVLPRVVSHEGLYIPSREFVSGGEMVWLDFDDPEAVENLDRLAHRPHLIVSSGSGGCHCYWRVRSYRQFDQTPRPKPRALSAREIERANGRLIAACGGDPASRDRLRFLRIPGSTNQKSRTPCLVQHADLASDPYDIADLVGELPDPQDTKSQRRSPNSSPYTGTDRHMQIDPAHYVPELALKATGEIVDIDRFGYCLCPLPGHDERTGSFHCYPTAERGWYCFGCAKGGNIYNLAAELIGLDSHRDWEQVRDFVGHTFG